MVPEYGNDIPRTSAREFIVDAVPIVLQYPTDVAPDVMISFSSRSLIFPSASKFRAFHATATAPTRSPLYQPFSIGPLVRTIAGKSTVAAAMMQAGVVLSQPVVRTTPSNG